MAVKFSNDETKSNEEGKVMMRIESELFARPDLMPYSQFVIHGKGDGHYQGRYYIFMDYANGGVC